MLIGLHGKKQAGKDTVHERIAARFGVLIPVERVSFADRLYESAAAALSVDVEFLRRWKSEPGAGIKLVAPEAPDGYGCLSFREYLQHYGTEAHRDLFGTNFWVDNVDLADHAGRIVVVTDVRFENEAQAVINAGGSVVHVVGPEGVENAGDGHASEAVLPSRYIDHVLPNTVRDDDFVALDNEAVGLVLQLLQERGGRP